MLSDDAATIDSTFTPWRRTFAVNGGVAVGFGGFLLLLAGLWRAFDSVFLVSHPSSPVDALLLYADYLTAGALLAIFGFELARRVSDGGVINYGIIVGLSGLFLFLGSVEMAVEFTYTMWPSLGVVDALLKYLEPIVAGAFVAVLGFGLAPKVSDVRAGTAHVVGVAITIVAVTALAVGVYLYPAVFS